MDDLVDGYGVHCYFRGDPKKTVDERINELAKVTFAAGRKVITPFWLTEWGFSSLNYACPVDDEARRHLIAVERFALQQFINEPETCRWERVSKEKITLVKQVWAGQ